MVAVACRRRRLTVMMGAALTLVTGAVLLQPGMAACAVMDALPLQRLPDGSLADGALTLAERRAAVADHAAARHRIARTFGPPRAGPVLVQLSQPDALWPFFYNSFGSTDFLPGRTCIVIGPEGRNVDVLAHELMHAELAARVGFWRRRTQIPVWFDEGVGMQVDTRSAFDRPHGPGAADIRQKVAARDFFAVPPDELTEHYALAKREVGRWLDRKGRATLYSRLSAIGRGEPFETVWAR